jgi:hypothetical protein
VKKPRDRLIPDGPLQAEDAARNADVIRGS